QSNETVLDVGSGNAPNWRANFLCDKFAADATERLGSALPPHAGRPFVVGDALRLPFRDHAFDFVVCSHVLEHVEDPLRMLGELSRVARRGYLETPSRVWEKLHSWPYHRWLVSQEAGRLVLEPKSAPVLEPELSEWIAQQVATEPLFQRLWMRYWEYGLAMQYWWAGEIPAEVREGAVLTDEFVKSVLPEKADDAVPPPPTTGMMARLDSTYGRWLRRNSQPRLLDWLGLLACPMCRGSLRRADNAEALTCVGCKASYPVHEDVPILIEEAIL
ncbi:MAG: methyltransferase domain-containing protein, partial [Bacteroidota bacterium]